jgi:hypothetical protein
MKPGDLVRFKTEIQRLLWSQSACMVIDVKLYFDQVSEPHGHVDILMDGVIKQGIPHEWLEVISDT